MLVNWLGELGGPNSAGPALRSGTLAEQNHRMKTDARGALNESRKVKR